MANEDLQPVLREMSGRLGAIEEALKNKSCERHQQWLGDHERRIRSVEVKIYTIWIGMIIAGGVLGYWLEAVLK